VFGTVVRRILTSAPQLMLKALRPDAFRELPDEFVLFAPPAGTRSLAACLC
jgi:hypothetical protein